MAADRPSPMAFFTPTPVTDGSSASREICYWPSPWTESDVPCPAMKIILKLFALFTFALAFQACSKAPDVQQQTSQRPRPTPATAVYVTNEASGNLTVIDAETNQVFATVPLGKRPRGIHLSPDGKLVYVALSGSPIAPPGVDEDTLPPPDKSADGIGVVDAAQNAFLKLMPVGSDPEEFTLSLDGSKFYVANEDVGVASIVNVASGQIIKSLPVGDEPEGVGITPDGKFVYVTSEDDSSVALIDTATDNLVKTIKVGRRPRAVAFLPDGSRAYVTAENDGTVAVIDTAKKSLLKTIKLEGEGVKPMGIAVAPDGRKIYVSTGRFGKVFAIDTATEKVIGSVEVGTRPWGIAITPDGKTLYTANGPSNDVSVLDAETLQVKAKVKVGDRPWGIAIRSTQPVVKPLP